VVSSPLTDSSKISTISTQGVAEESGGDPGPLPDPERKAP
jgi:hypothetical protein